jgi:hypothetical protein
MTIQSQVDKVWKALSVAEDACQGLLTLTRAEASPEATTDPVEDALDFIKTAMDRIGDANKTELDQLRTLVRAAND